MEEEKLHLPNDVLLDIRDLHVHFSTREGTVKALDGVTFEIFEGETLGVVGESGCGKSVTSQAILQIIPQPGKIVQGEVILRSSENSTDTEIDVAQLHPHSRTMREIRRRRISIIFQEPMSSLSPIHTIGDQIIEAIHLYKRTTAKEARAKAIEMLQLVGIPEPEQRIDSYTFELSGGMRQRAMIAMALVSRPSLLIADEPTTAIDVTIQAQILELLGRLQEQFGMAIMLITHNLGVVATLARRVVVMYWGRVVEKSLTEEIFDNPKHPYTKGLLQSVPKINVPKADQQLWAIRGVVPHPYANVPGCTFHPRCESFMPGICDTERPELSEVAPGHYVSCFLYSKPQLGR